MLIDISDPVRYAQFLRQLTHALQVAGWTWPLATLRQLEDEIAPLQHVPKEAKHG